MNQKYSPEKGERVLRMLDQARASGEHRNLMTALRHIEGLLGMSPETLHVWHRCRGVEFLRRVLKDTAPGFLTSRRYRAAKTRPASARHLRNELLIAVIKRLHEKNYGIYRVRKVHALLKRKD